MVAGERTVLLSDLDTARFGVRIGRATVTTLEQVDEVAGCCDLAMAIVRCDAADLRLAQAIEDAGGRLCDTLVWFARQLDDLLPWPDGVREATEGDRGLLAGIAAAAFAGYGGHYHADPRLDRAAADATYADWARRSIGTVDRVWVAEDAGFLTLRRNGPDETEIVLNAVRPDRQRQGLYARLVRAALAWSDQAGAKRCIVSTQLSNVAVQRVWARLGFVPSSSLHTFHLWYGKGGGL